MEEVKKMAMKDKDIECKKCGTKNKILPFGYGYVATCSKCREVLYNSTERPSASEDEALL